MRNMYTIAENKTYEIEIKKSKFIAQVYKVYTIKEIDHILIDLRKKYSSATHICYAYKLGNTAKFSDDGEPGGTAGLPMMEILNKNQLNYILAVVIRYFGGIKLGSGGLVRAYSSSLAELIKTISKKELINGFQIRIICSYEKSKQLDYVLKDIKNIKKEYTENIIYTLEIEEKQLQELKEWNPQKIKNEIIEKNPKI